MPQLRRDPVGGRWVIAATERAARPRDFQLPRRSREGGFCPFCEGNEDKTPAELYACREPGSEADEPGWWIRVVPNKYPALVAQGDLNLGNVGVYQTMTGLGHHEVFIEGTEHAMSLSQLPEKTVEDLVLAYRARMRELKKDSRLVYALVFKNVGEAAGASLHHSHSQLICTPVLPRRVQEEMGTCEQYHRFQDRCLLCEMIDQERESGERVVWESEDFFVFCPYASRFPFEMWLAPKRHASHFENQDSAGLRQFGRALHEVLRRLDAALDNPPYNYVLHTSPFTVQEVPHYHWHLEVMPRLTYVAGFEWGTGFHINPVIPAQAAECLREPEDGVLGPAKRERHGSRAGAAEPS